MARPALMLVQTLTRFVPGGADQADEVLGLADEALAALTGPSPLRAMAHTERGLALLAADRPADAVADLAEGVAGWTAEGLHPQAVGLRVDLAAAYHAAGRHLEAAEVAEEALPALTGPDDAESAHRARLILAHAQKEMGEEEAAAGFAALAEDAAKAGRHDAVAHFLEEAGGVLTALDMDALAAERYAASAEAYEEAGDPYGTVRTRRRAALCLLWSGDTAAAVTAAEEARAALPGLPAGNEPARIWETALVAFDQARILAEAGRLEDAESCASAAVDGFSTLDETEPAEQAEQLRQQIRAAMG
ncbi:hypothetical protein ACFQHO_16795 [Actinomadura yumaensis]|uniref:hypothetical protein n=1 Tax=Actinomadura yumaensis TaxID=111807 RepID=UPI0036243C16